MQEAQSMVYMSAQLRAHAAAVVLVTIRTQGMESVWLEGQGMLSRGQIYYLLYMLSGRSGDGSVRMLEDCKQHSDAAAFEHCDRTRCIHASDLPSWIEQAWQVWKKRTRRERGPVCEPPCWLPRVALQQRALQLWKTAAASANSSLTLSLCSHAQGSIKLHAFALTSAHQLFPASSAVIDHFFARCPEPTKVCNQGQDPEGICLKLITPQLSRNNKVQPPLHTNCILKPRAAEQQQRT